MKDDIIDLGVSVSSMKYIGEYLTSKLEDEGIYSGEDLLDALYSFGNPNENPLDVRLRVREWLRWVLENARPNQCIREHGSSKNVQNVERYYKSRVTNNNAYNAIINFWRYYAEGPQSGWIPYKFRTRANHRAYPLMCRT